MSFSFTVVVFGLVSVFYILPVGCWYLRMRAFDMLFAPVQLMSYMISVFFFDTIRLFRWFFMELRDGRCPIISVVGYFGWCDFFVFCTVCYAFPLLLLYFSEFIDLCLFVLSWCIVLLLLWVDSLLHILRYLWDSLSRSDGPSFHKPYLFCYNMFPLIIFLPRLFWEMLLSSSGRSLYPWPAWFLILSKQLIYDIKYSAILVWLVYRTNKKNLYIYRVILSLFLYFVCGVALIACYFHLSLSLCLQLIRSATPWILFYLLT